MPSRKDGLETRQRILEAAAEVFSSKGYRSATVAEICRRAGANAAAVNYHFRDKESLYVAVWELATGRVATLYPGSGGVPDDAPLEAKIRGVIRVILHRMTDEGELGYFQKLKLMEAAHPTGLIDHLVALVREPVRERLRRLVSEFLDGAADSALVGRVESGIAGQCLAVAMTRRGPFAEKPDVPLTEAELQSWTDHIFAFSLGGMERVRKRPNRRAGRMKRRES